MENQEHCDFVQIVSRKFVDGVLHLWVLYGKEGEEHILEHPSRIGRKYVPLELAKYTKENMIKSSRRG
eukprot:5631628-Ditylum_brightwellii.AAC.1